MVINEFYGCGVGGSEISLPGVMEMWLTSFLYTEYRDEFVDFLIDINKLMNSINKFRIHTQNMGFGGLGWKLTKVMRRKNEPYYSSDNHLVMVRKPYHGYDEYSIHPTLKLYR